MVKDYKAPKLINSVVKVINRTGVGRSETLVTTGKRSQRPREVPVSPIEVDSKKYIVAPYGTVSWVLNARQNPAAVLRRGSGSTACRLVEVTDEAAHVVEAYWQRESFPRQYMDLPENPTTEDFEAAVGQFPVFRVEPSD